MPANMLDDIQGDWNVIALGAACPFNLAGDKKRIKDRNGDNFFSEDVRWGYFTVKGDEEPLTLNYDDPRNPEMLRHVRDRIYRDSDGWRGTLYLCNTPIFEFRLERRTD